VRPSFLNLCVVAAALFWSTRAAAESHVRLLPAPLQLQLRSVGGPRPLPLFLQPVTPVASDATLRFEDMTQRVENTVTSFLVNAQHLGSPYRSWLWVTPVFTHQWGVTVGIDLP
jgi:hypothetical protein